MKNIKVNKYTQLHEMLCKHRCKRCSGTGQLTPADSSYRAYICYVCLGSGFYGYYTNDCNIISSSNVITKLIKIYYE